MVVGVDNNDNFNVNANYNDNNNRPALGITPPTPGIPIMKTYKHIYKRVYSWDNLEDAYWRARRGKSGNPKVKEFEKHWRLRLCELMHELRNKTYRPKPLKTFILRDPKTRRICVSHFRDRIAHHALVNILEPIFEPGFIHDSYASRRRKGTLTALNRFDRFKQKTSRNGRTLRNARNANEVKGFAFKGDIRHYFESVDHEALIGILSKRIRDSDVIWLVRTILNNHHSEQPGKGMPLGNWTSQFFANVYRNELDRFAKHELKAKYYIRYVDDFVILHPSKDTLRYYETRIRTFLGEIKLELHPEKCSIAPLSHGIAFLGFRSFYHHRILKRKNILKIQARLSDLIEECTIGQADASDVLDALQGWAGYAMHGNTYRLRTRLYLDAMARLTPSDRRPR